MRQLLLLLAVSLFFIQCKKYKDPNPISDPRINNPYCNDPKAVNYNWGFPGIPDNSICIYPAEVFSGDYFYRDSVYNSSDLLIQVDSFDLNFLHSDSVHFAISGFCNSLKIYGKANRFFQFNLDSLVSNGQVFCNSLDTISGQGSKRYIDDSLIQIRYDVLSPTGIVTHKGFATKK